MQREIPSFSEECSKKNGEINDSTRDIVSNTVEILFFIKTLWSYSFVTMLWNGHGSQLNKECQRERTYINYWFSTY